MTTRRGVIVGRILVIPLLLLAMEGVVAAGVFNELFVAPPSAFIPALGRNLVSGDLLPLTWITIRTVGMATVVCFSIGIPLGYLFWKVPVAQRAYEPMLGGLLAAPTILLYPVFLIFFGRTAGSIIALTTLGATVPVILNTRQSLADVNPVLLRVGQSMRLTERQIFRHILLPAAVPVLFAGLRLGMIFILLAVVALEYIVGIGGLGFFISDMSYRFKTANLFAGITMVLILSVGLMYLLTRAQKAIR